jgi:SAM-dependent methyltransferase
MIEEFYKNKLVWDDRISSVIDKKHSNIDPYILQREPKLSFTEDGKIDIDLMYPPSLEIRTSDSPYYEYYQCVKRVFNLSEIGSFCDVGCSTGHLIDFISTYNSVDVAGIEYFQYQKDNASSAIRDCINILDIRDSFDIDIKFDIVNCTEVAEHVDPKYLHVFLDNIKKITGKYLILSWSDSYPPSDAPPQHVSPLPLSDVKLIMESWGFEYLSDETNLFNLEARQYNNYYPWWKDNITIWKIK